MMGRWTMLSSSPTSPGMGARDLAARRGDGGELPVDISLGAIPQPDGSMWTPGPTLGPTLGGTCGTKVGYRKHYD